MRIDTAKVTKQHPYEYGKYYEGMTAEDAKKLKKSLFENPLKEFNKINTDGDDKLSENEMRNYHAKSKRTEGYICAVGAAVMYILGGITKSKITRIIDFGFGCWNTANTFSAFNEAKRISAGKH